METIYIFYIFATIGVVLMVWMLWRLVQASRSSSWPNTLGKITRSELKTLDTYDQGTRTRTYAADVAYDFEARGKPYQGKRITFSDDTSTSIGRYQRILKKYPVGKTVKVYYDQSNPSLSVLQPGVKIGNFLQLFVALVFLGTGVFGTLHFSGVLKFDSVLDAVRSGFRESPAVEKAAFTDMALWRCVNRIALERNWHNSDDAHRISCQEKGIKDLSGLAQFHKLEALYLQGNSLVDLTSLEPLPSVRTISVAGNKLTTLDGIENLPKLVELQANMNNISDIGAVARLGELRIVGLMKNRVSDISALDGLPGLEQVVLNYNPIDCRALREFGAHHPNLGSSYTERKCDSW